ncbi:1-acyl-sn-glycerol-3-phosphate acyltransferase epsilon-like [Elgaria multicarinata webbii]|uniref:1-acyl-sn-glycerol-3-phosphate acyltransferase epsilon-like n=1 Tax=Elgaria multicarinata webbii TaxID=159646 RepID=UPI002FCCE5B9
MLLPASATAGHGAEERQSPPPPPPLAGGSGVAGEASRRREPRAQNKTQSARKMLLSLVLPAAVMLGAAPTYMLAWGAWRLLSTVLPARFYHEVDDRLYTIYQSMVLFFFENYTGVQIILYGDLPKTKENVLFVSNHQCTVDWIIADMLAIRQNALGHVRYVLKDPLKWLPLYGWYFSQHGGIYVKRSAKFNEKKMRNKLQTHIKAESPMYLVIFPEGTRYSPELPKVIADSQSYADKEGLAVLKHVLTPRVKAIYVAVDSMKNYLDAVYDVTVAYEGTLDHKGQRKVAPSMKDFLCKECPRIHIFVDRIELKDIPKEQIFMKRWLHERFEIKDKLLTEFYDAKDSKRRNKFPGKCVHSKLSLKKTLPSLLFLCGLTVSMLLTEFGRELYMKTWIYGTLLGCLWVSVKV